MPQDSHVKRQLRWFIEDARTAQGTQGVAVEFLRWNHGGYVKFTPFIRRQETWTDPTTERVFRSDVLLDDANSLTVYDADKSGQLVSVWEEIDALVVGEVSGRFEEAIMHRVLHQVVPEEWAKRFLPELVGRLAELGLNWKYEKVS